MCLFHKKIHNHKRRIKNLANFNFSEMKFSTLLQLKKHFKCELKGMK